MTCPEETQGSENLAGGANRTILGQGSVDLAEESSDQQLHSLTSIVRAIVCDQGLPLQDLKY